MMVEEAMSIGVELEKPPGDVCKNCGSPDHSCGTRQSVKSFYGKSLYLSSLCFTRSERKVLDTIQKWRQDEQETFAKTEAQS
jgi:hypothetical protein